MNSLYTELDARGFIAQTSDPSIASRLATEKITVYAGFDPTATSLHLGSLVPIMALAHFQRHGHKVLAVVGGATGMIGDPSGKSDERSLLTPEKVRENVEGIKTQMARFIDFDGDNAALMLDNLDWTAPMSFIDWLRDVGKYFTVNYMIAKESVARRLESEQGISFTEFSYMTMQAHDFLHLFDHHGCAMQCGGNDQWGNITAGIDLIRKVRKKPAYGITFPLIATASGEKFGKSAGNAMWLDPTMTTPWDFYQYLIRQEDADVVRFLNLFTFLPLERISELAVTVQEHPELREAQKALAYEVTKIVHGERIAEEMVEAATILHGSEIKEMTDDTLAAVFASVPSTSITRAQLEEGMGLIDLLAATPLAASRGEAKRLLKAGGVYVNNVRMTEDTKLTKAHLASPSYMVLRSGKKNYALVSVAP